MRASFLFEKRFVAIVPRLNLGYDTRVQAGTQRLARIPCRRLVDAQKTTLDQQRQQGKAAGW
jgi:hypothetical protein